MPGCENTHQSRGNPENETNQPSWKKEKMETKYNNVKKNLQYKPSESFEIYRAIQKPSLKKYVRNNKLKLFLKEGSFFT